MATWTTWRYVDNVIMAYDFLVAWNNFNGLESGQEAYTDTLATDQVANRLRMAGMAATFPELDTDYRLRRINVRFRAKSAINFAVRFLTYAYYSSYFWKEYDNATNAYVLQDYDDTIAGWKYPTANDGQAAMEAFLTDNQLMTIRANNNGSLIPTVAYIDDLEIRVQYDDPPPPPPQNAGLFLGM